MDGSVGFVVDRWVVLGVVVCPIVTAFIPVVAELLLRFSAVDDDLSLDRPDPWGTEDRPQDDLSLDRPDPWGTADRPQSQAPLSFSIDAPSNHN